MIPFKRHERKSARDMRAHDMRGRPPPNYFSRGVQVKLLGMVFLFMAVVWLMFEARKPQNWRWMWQLEGRAASRHVTAAGAKEHRSTEQDSVSTAEGGAIDTWGPLEPAAEEEETMGPNVSGTEPLSWSSKQQSEQSGRPGAKMQLDGWNDVLRRLSKEQRERLQTGLRRWREQQRFSGKQAAAWSVLVRQLDENWSDYHARAERSVVGERDVSSDEQARTRNEVIAASKDLWNARKGALAAIASDIPVTQEQAAELTELQHILDRHAWARVKDNSVLRSAETAAWYRCWEQLQSLSPRQANEAVGPLNFVQLYSQPKELRGRLVKVRGTVRSGYRAVSRDARFGIEGYIVLGLLPSDGSNSPVVVYCRELPDGFPTIGPANQAGQGVMLDEDVEITGYYFKRWLHRCEGGMNLSPLILGQVTAWQPRREVAQRSRGDRLSVGMVLAATSAMALLSILIAVAVYRSSCWSGTGAARAEPPLGALPSFDTQHVRGGVSHSLREFAGQQTDERG
ncbi:MAG: hypothetical protein ACODAD_02275 [Planctomycetota bacterium]